MRSLARRKHAICLGAERSEADLQAPRPASVWIGTNDVPIAEPSYHRAHCFGVMAEHDHRVAELPKQRRGQQVLHERARPEPGARRSASAHSPLVAKYALSVRTLRMNVVQSMTRRVASSSPW